MVAIVRRATDQEWRPRDVQSGTKQIGHSANLEATGTGGAIGTLTVIPMGGGGGALTATVKRKVPPAGTPGGTWTDMI